jgi:phosphonate transport system substrate-binding protein
MTAKRIFALLFVATGIFAVITWHLHRYIVDIAHPYPVVENNTFAPGSPVSTDTVRIGVISRYPSNVIYQGYQPMMDYLSAHTAFYFELVISASYAETVEQLHSGMVDAAFLGSYVYIMTRDSLPFVPVLKPLNEDGRALFQSALIVREDAPYQRVSDLRGQRLALPSELSYSSSWLINQRIGDYDLSTLDFSGITYFQHHHTVVYEIMRGNYAAGSVKERVAREFEGNGIRIISQSDPVPGSPLVASRHSRQEVVEAVSSALLGLDLSDPDTIELVRRWDPEFAYGFARAHPEDYDLMSTIINGGRHP